MEVIYSIERLQKSKNSTKQVISEFLLKNLSDIGNLSMQQIANETYTSKATLVRYAQAIGYKGWNDFIFDLLLEHNERSKYSADVDPNIPFSAHTTHPQIASNIADILVESIRSTEKNIDHETLNSCCELILNSKNIVIFGVSPNTLIAQSFARNMKFLGIPVHVAFYDEQRLMATLMSEDDCAICISYSGNNVNEAPMTFYETFKANNVKTIAITSMGDNYLRSVSDYTLSIYSREKLYSKIANYTSEQSIVYLLQLIYSICFQKNYSENSLYKFSFSKRNESKRESDIELLKE